MKVILDWMLIILSTYVLIDSIIKIIKRDNTVMDYCVLVFYVFNCFPVLLDYIFGIPNYNSWYFRLEEAMNDTNVALIYDIYMLIVLMFFYFYKILNKRSQEEKKEESIIKKSHRNILILLCLLPHIYILITGNLTNFLGYESLNSRNIGEISIELINLFNQISIIAFSYLYFCAQNVKCNKLILILYTLSIWWIDGKRYIVLTTLIIYVFLYIKSGKMKFDYKRFIKYAVIGISLFSIFYIIYSQDKMKRVYTTSDSEMSFYADFRLNFGRDDVVKFVIKEEFIDKKPILEYRGQSILYDFVMFVPRSLFLNKPYPHYRYLSAAIYDTNIFDIPSGITPSIFEMGIANFSYLGIILTPLIMLGICKLADTRKSIIQQSIYLVIIVNLLTQSLDAAIGFVFILIAMFIYKLTRKKGTENEVTI